jgi:hypothetical protein
VPWACRKRWRAEWVRTEGLPPRFCLGRKKGAAETARELGIRHVAYVERVEEGPKILRLFFDAAQRMTRHELVCYANRDSAGLGVDGAPCGIALMTVRERLSPIISHMFGAALTSLLACEATGQA